MKIKAFSDVHLLQREYVNIRQDKNGRMINNTFTLKFTRDLKYDGYVLSAGKALGPHIAFCLPGEPIYLPHGYYFIEALGLPKGEPIDVLMNLENAMLKGNKTPSNMRGENQ